MSALLKTGLSVLEEHVLTPRGNDMYPGTWTDGHPSPKRTYHTLGILTTKRFMVQSFAPGGWPANPTLQLRSSHKPQISHVIYTY